MALIGINRGDDLPDDCTIVIHKPAVPDERMPAHVMLEQAELLADALVKYLPGVTLMTLRDALERRIHDAIARQVSKVIAEQDKPIGQRVYEAWREQTKSASADRGYDTLSCGHVVTRWPAFGSGGVSIPNVIAKSTDGPIAWCDTCYVWKSIDPQQLAEFQREIREALK